MNTVFFSQLLIAEANIFGTLVFIVLVLLEQIPNS